MGLNYALIPRWAPNILIDPQYTHGSPLGRIGPNTPMGQYPHGPLTSPQSHLWALHGPLMGPHRPKYPYGPEYSFGPISPWASHGPLWPHILAIMESIPIGSCFLET